MRGKKFNSAMTVLIIAATCLGAAATLLAENQWIVVNASDVHIILASFARLVYYILPILAILWILSWVIGHKLQRTPS